MKLHLKPSRINSLPFVYLRRGSLLYLIAPLWMICCQVCLAQLVTPHPATPQAQPPANRPANQNTASQSPRNAFTLFGDSQDAVRKGLLFYASKPLSEQNLRHIDGTNREFSVTIPLTVDRKRNRLFVTALINDQKVRLTVDTGGGPGVVLDKAAAKRVVLNDPFPARLHGGQGYEPVTEGIGHSMTFGSLTLRAIDTIVRQDAVPGMLSTLGMQVFGHYRITMDFTANTMTLSRGGTPSPARKGEESFSVPFRDDGGFIFVPVRLPNQLTWANLDTGNNVNTLSLSMARTEAAQLSSDETLSHVFYGKFATGDPHKSLTLLYLARPIPVSLNPDGMTTSSTMTRFSTTSQIGMSGFDEVYQDFQVHPDVSLGTPFLLQFRRVIIDYPNHMLILQGLMHGAPANLTSLPAPGKPWPGYVWQRSGDGWVEAPDESAPTALPSGANSSRLKRLVSTTITTVNNPNGTSTTTTAHTYTDGSSDTSTPATTGGPAPATATPPAK